MLTARMGEIQKLLEFFEGWAVLQCFLGGLISPVLLPPDLLAQPCPIIR